MTKKRINPERERERERERQKRKNGRNGGNIACG